MHLLLRRWLPVLLALLAVGPAGAMDGVPPDRTIAFDIVRQGTVVGQHKITFAQDGARLMVDIDVTVKVDVAFITVYRFTHRAHEVWEGDRLVAMTASTNDDGTPHELAMMLRDGSFEVTHNGTPSRVPAGLVPTSLWDPATVTQTALFGSLRGDAQPTTVTPLGQSVIDTPGGPVTAEGYFIDAEPDFQRKVWYSAAGQLVAVALKGGDGSDVTYRLR